MTVAGRYLRSINDFDALVLARFAGAAARAFGARKDCLQDGLNSSERTSIRQAAGWCPITDNASWCQ